MDHFNAQFISPFSAGAILQPDCLSDLLVLSITRGWALRSVVHRRPRRPKQGSSRLTPATRLSAGKGPADVGRGVYDPLQHLRASLRGEGVID